MSDKTFKQLTIDMLKQLLPAEVAKKPFQVLNAYPNKLEALPCVSVLQRSGGLDTQFVGGEYAGPYQGDDGAWKDAEGAYYRESLEIAVWANNPRTRDTLAPVLRVALFKLFREYSRDYDVQKMTLEEDGDDQNLDEQAPLDLFGFVFRLGGVVPLTIEHIIELDDGFELTADFNTAAAEQD